MVYYFDIAVYLHSLICLEISNYACARVCVCVRVLSTCMYVYEREKGSRRICLGLGGLKFNPWLDAGLKGLIFVTSYFRNILCVASKFLVFC